MEAIDKIKTAFYMYIAKALKEKKGMVASPTEDYLDILKVSMIRHKVTSFSVIDPIGLMKVLLEQLGTDFKSFMENLSDCLIRDTCTILVTTNIHVLCPHQDGYVFRLRIHYPRQLPVLDEAAASSDTQANVARLKSRATHLKKSLVSLPVHTSTLHG